MQPPPLAPEHAVLARLVGAWRGDEVHPPSPFSPEGATATGRLDIRLACGGRFVVSDYTQLRDGLAVFTGHGVYGWDPAAGCYAMHWADSMTAGGFLQPVRGRLEDGILTFETDSQPRTRYRYAFPSPDELDFRIESSPDALAWSCVLAARYVRHLG